MKFYLSILFVISILFSGYSSNLANPAAPTPTANVTVGASYHLGGYTLTNLEIPALFNRFNGRIEYAPITYVNIGVDLGATQIDVDRCITSTDTIDLFHGNYGFSGGAYLKLSTPPILNNSLSFFTIGKGTMFSSKNDDDAEYGGYDGTGVVGLQVHIPNFGYISAGPMVYLIEGEAKGIDGKEESYSNSNNVRGWIAIDYFLKGNDLIKGNTYISVEFSASPKIDHSSRIPLQECSFSVSIGYVTGKLYGFNKGPK